MRILLLDCETSAHLVDVWGLFQQNVPLSHVHQPGYMICWAAKWLGEREIMFSRANKNSLKELHKLLDEADVVVSYNGKKFDVKVINQEFVLAGLPPCSPFQQIDLLLVVRQNFRFASNKLAFVAPALGIGNKTAHPGHELWTRCLDGEEKAWRLMERYNKQDVRLLEKLYHKLLPWIKAHPNRGLFSETKSSNPKCPRCGSAQSQRRGETRNLTTVYARYQCRGCGGWFRGAINMGPRPNKKYVAL